MLLWFIVWAVLIFVCYFFFWSPKGELPSETLGNFVYILIGYLLGWMAYNASERAMKNK